MIRNDSSMFHALNSYNWLKESTLLLCYLKKKIETKIPKPQTNREADILCEVRAISENIHICLEDKCILNKYAVNYVQIQNNRNDQIGIILKN